MIILQQLTTTSDKYANVKKMTLVMRQSGPKSHANAPEGSHYCEILGRFDDLEENIIPKLTVENLPHMSLPWFQVTTSEFKDTHKRTDVITVQILKDLIV